MNTTKYLAAYESPVTDFLYVESEGVLCESDVWGGGHGGFKEEEDIIY